jgi:hypothetical protein
MGSNLRLFTFREEGVKRANGDMEEEKGEMGKRGIKKGYRPQAVGKNQKDETGKGECLFPTPIGMLRQDMGLLPVFPSPFQGEG